MGKDTKIQWASSTLNFWIGCDKISPACTNCYAERYGRRDGTKWGPNEPRRPVKSWRKNLREIEKKAAKNPGQIVTVFVNSLSDFWDKQVPDDWKIAALESMVDAAADFPNIRFLLLTKRPKEINRFLRRNPEYGLEFFKDYDFFWVGTTVEDQKRADERIPELLKVQAGIRFLSMEPLLGPVTLFYMDDEAGHVRGPAFIRDGAVTPSSPNGPEEYHDTSYVGIDWVIVGGESGPGARRFDVAHARKVIQACRSADVPVFMKQMGDDPIQWREDFPGPGVEPHKLSFQAIKGGDMTEWPEEFRIREWPDEL